MVDSNVLPRLRATSGARLPLRDSPVVFAVDNGDGTTENLWGVGIVEDRPAVYCGCRYPFDDRMWRDRWSETLRLWGRNRTTLRLGTLDSLSPGHLLWLRWPPSGAHTVPCYKLYLPELKWRVRLDEQERLRRVREFPEWREPHVLIQGSGEEAPVVSIIQLPKGAPVREVDGHRVSAIGVLPLDAESSLHVIATMESREPASSADADSSIFDPADACHDWDEDDVETVEVSMGSDEVGFASIVRAPVVWTP